MTGSTIPLGLLELRNPSSPDAQLSALRDLKNEIVGHDQRKEMSLRSGVVGPCVQILSDRRRRGGGGVELNGGGTAASREWEVEDETQLQVVLVVGSLALGGPHFVAPLLAGGILPPLLESLAPSEVPSKLIVATLQTIIAIADSVALDRSWIETTDGPLHPSAATAMAAQLYTKSVVDRFAEILGQTPSSAAVQQEIALTAQLITKTCQDDRTRNMLLNSGILDLLATKLAVMAASGDVTLRAIGFEQRHQSREALSVTYMSDILEAICAIVQGSNYRTARFLFSPATLEIFPLSSKSSGAGELSNMDSYSAPQGVDRFLPRLQAVISKNETQFSKAFPALSSSIGMNTHGVGEYTRMHSFSDAQQSASRTISGDEFESPIFPWLIHLARTRHGFDRLSAARLLSVLKKYNEAYPSDESPKNRERALAFLVVPLLVTMIQEAGHACDLKPKNTTASAQQKANDRKYLEQAQVVLADLIEGSPALQKAAVDARAIPALCTILKRSFDPVAASSKPLWSPRSNVEDVVDPAVDLVSSTLGRPGLTPELLHALRYREGALRSIAALTDREDMYRKVVIENGAVACITEALVPYPPEEAGSNPPGPKDGNPIPVLIAACWAARSMSRSVSILRTSLIDYGVAKPIHALLTHPNVEVQIAATEVLCNLVLHFSPMRESLIEAGSLKTICEHAHSANSRMRLNSLWALKHMVLTASNEVKIRCLDELGTGWLIRTIQGESKDYAQPPTNQSHASTPIGMGTPNAAGEQVDLLNAVDDPNMEVDDQSSSGDDADDHAPDVGLHVRRRPTLRTFNSATIRAELKVIKASEQDPRLRAENDDLRIQEQALDFIRNLIAESKAGAAEMIDHLLSTIGSARFFDIMASKLRPKPASASPSVFPPSPSRTRGSPLPAVAREHGLTFGQLHFAQPVLAPPEILLSVVFILIHIANGRPSHRALLISQTNLLNHVLPLFQHPDRRLRVACVWLVNNLTWMDDSSDMVAARERAMSLKVLGVEQKVRELMSDQDLDTRERAKTACEQMGKLLDGVNEGNQGFERRGALGGMRGWRGE